MKYAAFEIGNYRAIESIVTIDLSKNTLIPLVGINECGKTTILQAIYCFDYVNDSEYGGKHLKDTKNLYKTSEKSDAKVTAKVELKYNTFSEIYSDFLNEEQPKETEVNQSTSEGNSSVLLGALSAKKKNSIILPAKLPLLKENFTGAIHIERNLTSKKYFIRELSSNQEFSKSIHDSFARSIIAQMPYILYNDDFMDRPPTNILIPNTEPNTLSGWISIYERLFKSTSDDYSLFSLTKEKDTRRRDAILSDVQEKINKTLSKAWKTFLLSKHGEINIKLSIVPSQDPDKKSDNKLEIKIVERIGSKERFFDVVDRSKGFLWFFNFVMKMEFNPKVLRDDSETLYLLDEPGSYLHYSAQEKLCQKLVEISVKHGTVLYCTHSHTLLNPDSISINSIYIVEKNKGKSIAATPLAQVKTNVESSTAYQPIFEALQMSAFHIEKSHLPVIAVEGIYDKYAIEMFADLNTKFTTLPGTSANSILKNIQFLNGFNRKFVAIWDNDDEGRKQFEKAKDTFGEHESTKFDLLPSRPGGKSRRMEEMFDAADLAMILESLDLGEKASYERIISNLFYAKKEHRKRILGKISTTTLDNFKILSGIIEKRYAAALKLSGDE